MKKTHLLQALHAADIGIWDWDIATGRVDWGGTHAALFGLTPEAFGGHIDAVQACVHPDDRAQGMEVFQRTLDEESDFDNTYRVIWPDGSLHWMHSFGRLIRDEQGVARRIVGITRDVTGQHQAERQVAALSAVVRHSDAIVVVKDLDLRVIATNSTFARIAGYDSPGELIGKTDAEIFQVSPESEPVRSYMEDERSAQRLAPGQELVREELVIGPDGEQLYYLTKKYPIYDTFERLIGTGNISVNITERRLIEQQLRAANAALSKAIAEAEAANRAKSDFLANMSHEIRTPMHAMLGLAYLLEQMDLPAEAADFAHKIHRSGQSLLGILNDILDFSKIEAGQLELEHSPFYLCELLDNLAMLMATAAAGKGLELVIVPPPRHLCYLLGDSLRLGQVLINLTSNAIKFTQDGLVEVRITPLEEHSDRVTLQFSVRDTGIGIDHDAQSQLFSPFVQANRSTTRHFGGTGLGLTISQRIISLMGGEITLHSEPGQGSTFAFTLELTRQHDIDAPELDMAGHTVLVADDNPVSLEGLGASIHALNWHAELFDNAQALLERVIKTPELQTPQTVLLLDWQMPQPDGLAVARTLRTTLAPHTCPTILLLVAQEPQAMLDQIATGLIDRVLYKPLIPSVLYNAVLQVTHSQRLNTSPVAAQPNQPRLQDLHILVVDDSEINREVALHIFSHEGARVSLACDGQQALNWLMGDAASIDIVLMDIHMPVLGGLEATRRIREHPRLARLPVIALTAGALKEQHDQALAAGVSGFIAKPFAVDQAIALILSLTTTDRPPPPSLPDVASAPAQNDAAVLNTDVGRSLFRSAAAYERALRLFVSQYADLPERLRATPPDAEAMQALAHKLCGAAGHLGLEQLAASAASLETRLRCARATLQDSELLSQQLHASLDAIEQALGTATAETDSIARCLARALIGAELLAPQRIAQELKTLGHYLPEERLTPIRDALHPFSAEHASTALHALADTLGIELPR